MLCLHYDSFTLLFEGKGRDLALVVVRHEDVDDAIAVEVLQQQVADGTTDVLHHRQVVVERRPRRRQQIDLVASIAFEKDVLRPGPGNPGRESVSEPRAGRPRRDGELRLET